MSAQHTPEPWPELERHVGYDHTYGEVILSGNDYNRAKPCVDACAGIPTDDMNFSVAQLQADYLKISSLAANLTARLEREQQRGSKLTQQRDELQHLLCRCETFIKAIDPVNGRNILADIAKARGQQS